MITSAVVLLLLAAPPRVGAAAAPSPPAAAPTPPAEVRRAGDWTTGASGRNVSVDGDTTLDDALRRIADAAGWNLVVNTGAVGERGLSVRLRNVPVEEALDAVLQGTPLLATRKGNTVTIAPGRVAAPERGALAGFDRPTGKRFSGDFEDERVDAALRKVADAAGLSVVFPPGLRGAVSGHFRDAPVEDVLRALLGQAGLAGRRDGAVLTVAREGGASVVIRGGKRSLTFDLDVPGDAAGAGDDARAAAQTARETAKIAREKARAARQEARASHGSGRDRVMHGDQVIGSGERADDVVTLGGSVRLDAGAAARDVVAVLGSVDVGPGVRVDGDVVAVGGDVHVSPGARVAGDAVSVGGQLVLDESAVVEGQQVSVAVPGLVGLLSLVGVRSWSIGHSPALSVAVALVQFAVLFALGLLLLWVAPRRLETLTGAVVQAPLKTVLTGLLGTLAIPIAAILLAVTVIGIPLIAVLVLAVAAGVVMGYAALALYIGRALPLRLARGTATLQLAIGAAILVLAGKIPIVGILVWIAGWLLVLGVVLRTRFGRPPQPPVYGTTEPPPTPPPMPPTISGATGA